MEVLALLKEFLPLPSLYIWEWSNFPDRWPLCMATPTSFVVWLSFSSPEELKEKVLALTTNDLPLKEPESTIVRDLLFCGNVKRVSTDYDITIDTKPQPFFRTSTFAIAREQLKEQTNFPQEPWEGFQSHKV